MFVWKGQGLQRVVLLAHAHTPMLRPSSRDKVVAEGGAASCGTPIMSLRCSKSTRTDEMEKRASNVSGIVLVSGGKDGKVRLWRLHDAGGPDVSGQPKASEASEQTSGADSSRGGILLRCTGAIDAVVESKLAVNAGLLRASPTFLMRRSGLDHVSGIGGNREENHGESRRDAVR